MEYRQLVEPNLDPYITINGHVLTDWWGWCLAYVVTAFGAGWAGANAQVGWDNHADNKHADRNLPAGVYVPIWFSGASGMGHCAIYKDGQVWSSPWHHKPTADVLPSIEEVERIYGVSYLGWSEGLGGTIVVSHAPVAPYTVENIEAKQVTLNKNCHLWNLAFDNFTAIDANPVADAAAGTVLTVNAILHHNIGYNYYLTNPSAAVGYNTLDCDDFVLPPPPPRPLPEPPLTAPSNETYDLVVDLPGYITGNQAVNNISAKVTIPVGTYFVFNKYYGNSDQPKLLAINLTKTPGTPGAWVNVADNTVAPPEPAPEAAKAEVLAAELVQPDIPYEAQKPELYVAENDLTVLNLVTKKVVTMPKYSTTWISGTSAFNNTNYAIVQSGHDKGQFWGILWKDPYTQLPNLELESVIFNKNTTLSERRATKTLKTSDHLLLALASAKHIYLGFTSLFSKLKSVNKNKK